MKNIILTTDYELYLGENTGTVEECMINPTNDLMNILDYNNSKMTVFWDILHYYMLLKLEHKFSELKKDRIVIKDQILDMVKRGHDIQLHIHTHWLDAKFINGKWKFIYDRFKLHTLSSTNNKDDINSILGCVTISKLLIENVVREVDKNYKVTSYRAGGYLVEPFKRLKEAFIQNDIYIDASVCPELKNNSNVFSFNFKEYPKKHTYRFNEDIKKIDNNGRFIEIPITTFKIPLIRRVYFTILKRYKYRNFKSDRKGTGSASSKKVNISMMQKIRTYVYHNKYDKLTTDDSFKEKYNYLLSRSKNYSSQILHPKMLNNHSLFLFESNVKSNEIRYVSIKQFEEYYLNNSL